jgi:hypothetical protein
MATAKNQAAEIMELQKLVLAYPRKENHIQK